jgi:large subunit ribosomal protein L24
MKLIVGDNVKVMVGKDLGKTGLITRILPKKNKIFVEDVGRTVRHIKPNNNQSGERKIIFKPIDASKVAIVNEKGNVDRVGYKVDKKGEKTRFFKKSGTAITAQVTKTAAKKTSKAKKTTKK